MADVTPIRSGTQPGVVRVGVKDEQHAYFCSRRGEPYSASQSCCRGDQGELMWAHEQLRDAVARVHELEERHGPDPRIEVL